MNTHSKKTLPYVSGGVLVLTLLILFSCSGKQKKESSGFDIDPEQKTEKGLSDYFSSIEVIPLETSDSSIMAAADKLIYCRGKYYLLDVRSIEGVLIFDKDGKFLNKLVRMGRGPQEYYTANDFVVDPSNGDISIMSSIGGTVLVYDSTLTFRERYSINYQATHSFFPINDNTTAFYTGNEGKLFIYNRKNNSIEYEYLVSTESLELTIYKSSLSPFSVYNDTVQFLASAQKKVYNILPETGELKERYSFNFGQHDYDPFKLPENREFSFYHDDNKGFKKIYNINEFLETPDFIDVVYAFGEWTHTFIDKKTGEQHTFRDPHLTGFMYANEEALFMAYPAPLIERLVEKSLVDPEVWERVIALPADSNPVIVKYNFKR